MPSKKQTRINFVKYLPALIVTLLVGAVVSFPAMVQAATDPTDGTKTVRPCPSGQAHPAGSTACKPIKKAKDCPDGKVNVSDPTKCSPTDDELSKSLSTNPIVRQLNNIVGFLSAGVAIIVIGVIILGGIQYAMAGDNPTAISAAKQRILNGLIAFAAFLLTFAFLNWLIPGGIFR
ncbi:MAG: hypothetical protein WD887_00380 [Candidatus Saccharimonadales bacterium]